MTNQHLIQIEDKFENFKNFLELEEALDLIDLLIKFNILKIRTNSLVIKKFNLNRTKLLKNYTKKRAGLCMQLSKLLYYLTGKGEVVIGNIKFYNGESTSHSVLKIDNFYFDCSLSQFESVGISKINYDEFKPIFENFVFGFKEIRFKNFKSNRLRFIFPAYSILNNIDNIINFYPKTSFLKYHLEMKEEFLTKIKNYGA